MKELKGFESIYGTILFLGTSVGGNSMERGFYYMDRNNKFWELIDKICDTNYFSNKKNEYLASLNNESQKKFIRQEIKNKLKEFNIGISDIIESCENTTNSSDNGIIKTSIVYNHQLNNLVQNSKIIVLNGTGRAVKEFYKAVDDLKIDINNKNILPVYSSSGAANGTGNRRDSMWISIRKYL